MKPEKDPLFPGNSGGDDHRVYPYRENDPEIPFADDNRENSDRDDKLETQYEETETSRLLVVSEDSQPPEKVKTGETPSDQVPVADSPPASDPDGLTVPLIRYTRPAIVRGISGGNGGAPAKFRPAGKGNHQAQPNGTLNVLAAQTLKIASINGLGEVDKLENDLEDEIRYENRSPAKTAIGRIRRAGQHRIHSKVILLIVVVLNIIDCLLVISELVLDFLHVLLDREEVREMVYEFIDKMSKLHHKFGWEKKYEDGPHGSDREYISYHFLEYVLQAFVTFKPNVTAASQQKRSEECVHFLNKTAETSGQSLATYVTSTASQLGPDWLGESSVAYGACFGPFLSPSGNSSSYPSSSSGSSKSDSPYGYSSGDSDQKLKHHGYVGHQLLDVAHKLHYISVAILSVLVLLLFVKIFCSGKRFFKSRMQVFDGIVILISFTLDLVFIEGLAVLRLEEFIIIIIFLLPWRILRVLNSLIAAVLDQQRLNLKIMYKQKKKISRTLSETNTKMEVMQRHIEVLQALCTSRGLSVMNGEIVGTRSSNGKSSGKDTGHKHGSSGSSHKHGGSSGGLAGMMALGKLAFQAADALAPISNGYGQGQNHNNNNNNSSHGGGGSKKSPLANGHAAGPPHSASDDMLNRGEHPSHQLGTELTPVGHIKAESDTDLLTLEHELQQEHQLDQQRQEDREGQDVETGLERDASARQSADTTVSLESEDEASTRPTFVLEEDEPPSPASSSTSPEIIVSPSRLEADLDSVRVDVTNSDPPPASPAQQPSSTAPETTQTTTTTAEASAPQGGPTTSKDNPVETDQHAIQGTQGNVGTTESVNDTDAVSKL